MLRGFSVSAFSLFGLLCGFSHAMAADVAKVNGKVITDKDVLMSLSGMNEGQRQSYLKDPQAKKEVLDRIIDQEVLFQEGEKAKLDQSREFKEAQENFRKQYLATRILAQNIGPKLTDAQAKKYYERNKLRYSTTQAYVQHILLETEAKAKEVLKQAQESGADFQELAVKYSKDPSVANNRGEVGPVGWDSPFVMPFKDTALMAKEGEIAGPVRTQFGYHLIKILKRKPGKALTFEEVELQVKNDLRQELTEEFVAKLKRQSKVQINEAALNKL